VHDVREFPASLRILGPNFHNFLEYLKDDFFAAYDFKWGEFDHETVDADAPSSFAEDEVSIQEA
jgi:hypothetical protein